MTVAQKAALFLGSIDNKTGLAAQPLVNSAKTAGQSVAFINATTGGQIKNHAATYSTSLPHVGNSSVLLAVPNAVGIPGRQTKRLAGQHLGTALGVAMPPQY